MDLAKGLDVCVFTAAFLRMLFFFVAAKTVARSSYAGELGREGTFERINRRCQLR